ncbi:glycosyltransferase family 39 protein [Pseudoxanthomonas sp. X-1]|uniref:ArnT family glycosyltransferase n=1 Tax=Pseudoxanthomonas sp. X-1 TaxID=2571115 RepID=UPI00110A48A9|nr:glycosyltransferase family 39 protein [Pseudoxanthomonas sp. X-1]TMN24850.1 glycosyltransferase family 39 protein [Pseudoxanthomonas sp. X-1]UAY73628.1 glycosyltransferase family 39 protein [Pseudoxanthomonas sp. X-1]
MNEEARAQRTFLALWIVLTVIKVMIAARLPLFVDEAFYWQEGRHLAAAYSDLPGLTAWMTRLGTLIGGQHVLAIRMPFLLLSALLPWLLVGIGTRWFSAVAGWRAGSLLLLMPLSGSLGILAIPDVPMAFATVLCLDAGARLLQRIDAAGAAELALGLAIGALSHYRFVGVIGTGLIALLLIPEGRRVLRDVRVWVALAMGVAAWAPLIAWNIENADAGLRFQLVERHPWTFQWTGLWFLLVQAALVTPLLFFALLTVLTRALRKGDALPPQRRYFGLLGAVSTIGFFVLGFFADVERVSFHWPLPGYLPLLLAVPVLLRAWSPWLRRATWILCGLGLASVLGYYLVASVPRWRADLAGQKFYPYNFAGWNVLADAVREELARAPEPTGMLADNFKVGAELGFALGDDAIPVLDHPLNIKHGRAPQLRLWGLHSDGASPTPQLLVVGASEVSYKDLLVQYHFLCSQVGPLPPPRVINVDHGRQRFLLFRLPRRDAAQLEAARAQPCVTPAMAWIDTPVGGADVPRVFDLAGWAFKDGVGLEAVEVLIDGRVVARAHYGLPAPGVATYWKISNDPRHPDVGFRARVDASGLAPGQHWLGLRLHGRDGSVEDWSEQPIRLRKP